MSTSNFVKMLHVIADNTRESKDLDACNKKTAQLDGFS